jgi:hypothetical protein
MSFREKSAWITFILLLVVFGFYFACFGAAFFAGVRLHPGFSWIFGVGFFALFGVLVGAIIVGEIVLHIIVAVRSPADAKSSPQDERERLIALKAKRPAYFVLATTAFLSISLIHTGGGAFALVNGILFAIWLGELTNYGTQIYLYRRSA